MTKWVVDLRMCCVEGARIEPFVLIPDVQVTVTMKHVWIFSMGAVDSGVLLFSVSLLEDNGGVIRFL